jgi:uncharacterized protein YbaR (Trm112 family)
MSAKLAPTQQFDESIVGYLACPACHGDLRLFRDNAPRSEAPIHVGRLICAACGRAYPIVDGIPVLIVERVERPAENL